METISLVLFLAILSALSLWYLKHRYHSETPFNIVFIKTEVKAAVLIFIAYAAVLTLNILYSMKKIDGTMLRLLKWDTLFFGVLLTAVTDVRERKIPNELIAAMICIRIIFMAAEFLFAADNFRVVVVYPIIGGVIGAMIILVSMIISRNGVGIGDVKLFFVIGLYVGSTQIMAVMFYSVFVSAAFGLFLLATKRAKAKDYIPLAPFAFIGVALRYVLLLIGG